MKRLRLPCLLPGVLLAALLASGGCAGAPVPPPFAARLLRGHEAVLVACAVSPDGRFAVSADTTGGVRYWDLETERSLALQHGAVSSVAFGAGADRFVAGCRDGTVYSDSELAFGEGDRAYTFATAILQGHAGATANVRFTRDGKQFLSWDKDALLWEVRKDEPSTKIEGPVVAVSRDAKAVLVQRTGLALIDATTGLARWTSGEPSSAAAFSDDGALVAIGTTAGALELRDAMSGSVRARATGFDGGVRSLLFSPDGRLLVAGARTGDADRLLETADLREVRLLRWQTGAHAFSPDSARLASIVSSQWLVVQDVKTGQELAELWAGTRRRSWQLVFSPDGRFLVAETDLGSDRAEPSEARFFDAVMLKQLAVVEGSDLVFTRDSSRAVWLRASDGIVCVGEAPR